MKYMIQKLLITKTLLLVCAFGVYGIALAQPVTGRVTDQDNVAVSSAYVRLTDGSQGVSTNGRGEFSISAGKGAILIITSVGFTAQEVNVDDSPLVIKLEQNQEVVLSEVIVT